jgi:hypothetical protein
MGFMILYILHPTEPYFLQFALHPDPNEWGHDVSPNSVEEDDWLHRPDKNIDNAGSIFTGRGFTSLGVILLLIFGLLGLLYVNCHPLQQLGDPYLINYSPQHRFSSYSRNITKVNSKRRFQSCHGPNGRYVSLDRQRHPSRRIHKSLTGRWEKHATCIQ